MDEYKVSTNIFIYSLDIKHTPTYKLMVNFYAIQVFSKAISISIFLNENPIIDSKQSKECINFTLRVFFSFEFIKRKWFVY